MTTYTITTNQRTLKLEVGDTFARNPGEQVLNVRRSAAKGEAGEIKGAEKRWFLRTLQPHVDWTFGE